MSHRMVLRSAFAGIVTLLLSAAADAQLFRAYLDASGSDASPCTLPAPCRLLPAAIAAVANGGEIWMLDSANYNTGPVNVTKSVTILAVPGVVGSVVASGGNAIDIATAGVKVTLRNLVIVPLAGGGGTNGINMTSGAALTVEDCVIANMPGMGISVSGGGSVHVADTTIRGNGSTGLNLQDGARATVTRATLSANGHHGVLVRGTAASTLTTADIAISTLDGNGLTGVYALSSHASALVKVSVHDSRAVRNNGGMVSESNAGASVTISASSNIISNNANGLATGSSGGKIWASGNTVSDNGVGLFNAAAGVIESTESNTVRNNLTDKTGTITVIATK